MKSFHRRASRPAPRPADPLPPAPRSGAGVRADALLVQQGLAASRSIAQRLIRAGRVSGPNGVISKSAYELPADAKLSLAAAADDACTAGSAGGKSEFRSG